MVTVITKPRVPVNLPYQKPALIINGGSGSTLDIRDPARALALDYGLDLHAEYLEPANISGVVDALIEDGCDLLISYGGDGTSRHSGETARAHNLPFIPLPGGTMNMLPKLLYGDVEWDHALSQAFQSSERWQACGEMRSTDGKTASFFCGGFVGRVARLNDVREHLRDGDTTGALATLKEIIGDIDLDDTISFGPSDTPAASQANLINIQCPGMGEHAPVGAGLELTGLDINSPIDLAALGVNALVSDFRNASAATSFRVSEGHINYHRPPTILLDGEPVEMNAPITIHLINQGVRVLAPALRRGDVRDS